MVSVSATKLAGSPSDYDLDSPCANPCPCGSVVDARGLNGLSCKRSAGRSTRHRQLNDVIWRALRRADIPAIKEPSGLIPGSDMRPDGLTLISWQGGRCLALDATVVDTLAMSYLSTSSTDVDSAAKAAAVRKRVKYSAISSSHIFIPVAVETFGPINEAGDSFLAQFGKLLSSKSDDPRETFLAQVGKLLSSKSDDPRETFFLFQRISVIVQRFSEIAFRGTFIEESCHDE